MTNISNFKGAKERLPGNFVGPLVFLESESPTYATGFAVTLATSAAAGILALVYRMVCIRENQKRNATGSIEGFEYAYDDPTDRNVSLYD
jgi:hypothetical protein